MNAEIKASCDRLRETADARMTTTGDAIHVIIPEQYAKDIRTVLACVEAQRGLLDDIHTALLAAGWHDDELIRRVKAAAAK